MKRLSCLAAVMAALIATFGCAINSPLRVFVPNSAEAVSYPQWPEGANHFTVVNQQPVKRLIIVYRGYVYPEDVVRVKGADLEFLGGVVAVFGVGPSFNENSASLGIVRLSPGSYTAFSLAKSIGGWWLQWLPDYCHFRTTGFGLYSSFNNGYIQFRSDAIWVVPWINTQMRNPINFRINIPSVGQFLIDSFTRNFIGQ